MHDPCDSAMHDPCDSAMHDPCDSAMHDPCDSAMHDPCDSAMHDPPPAPKAATTGAQGSHHRRQKAAHRRQKAATDRLLRVELGRLLHAPAPLFALGRRGDSQRPRRGAHTTTTTTHRCQRQPPGAQGSHQAPKAANTTATNHRRQRQPPPPPAPKAATRRPRQPPAPRGSHRFIASRSRLLRGPLFHPRPSGSVSLYKLGSYVQKRLTGRKPRPCAPQGPPAAAPWPSCGPP
jgi:hypothetical protein